jgi:large subunit ribosomal protein L4
MPKRAVRAATRSAYLAKLQAGAVTVIDELTVPEPRTREVAGVLKALGIDRGCLIAIEGPNQNLWKSARNIARVALKPVAEVNAYDLLLHRRVLITKGALDALVAKARKARASAPEAAAAPAETPEPEPAAAGEATE